MIAKQKQNRSNRGKEVSCPGRDAARSGAALNRGPFATDAQRMMGPGSAQQRFALQRVRDTKVQPPIFAISASDTSKLA